MVHPMLQLNKIILPKEAAHCLIQAPTWSDGGRDAVNHPWFKSLMSYMTIGTGPMSQQIVQV